MCKKEPRGDNRLEGFRLESEYDYLRETFANGKEVVDLFSNGMRQGTCTVGVFKKYFLPVTVM